MRRMILPILRKYWKLLLSIALVSALGCGLMVGLSSAYTSLDRSLNRYVTEGRYPSAYVTTEVVNRSMAERLLAVEGVEAVNTRLVGDTVLNARGRYLSVRVFSFQERDLQRFHVWSQTEVGDQDSVMLEYNFAVDNGIQAGDVLEFRVGDERRRYAVSALVSAPETLNVQITDNSWGVNPDFGYAYAPVELLEKEDDQFLEDSRAQLDEQSDKLAEAEVRANGASDRAKRKLYEARRLLEEKEAEFAEAELAAEEQRQTLLRTQRELLEARAAIQKTLPQLLEAREELRAGIPQLEEAIDQLRQARSGLAELDAALSQLRSLRGQLNDNKVLQTVKLLRQLNPSMEIDAMFGAVQRIHIFVDLLQSLGYQVDESMTVAEAIPSINQAVDEVEADRDYLASEAVTALVARWERGEDVSQDPEYAGLLAALGRYGAAEAAEEDLSEAYRLACERNERLCNAILELRVRESLASPFVNSVTLGTLFSGADTARQLIARLRDSGTQVNTLGELLAVYDSSLAEANASIDELEVQRADLVAQLNENGVEEAALDDKLAELEAQLTEANEQQIQVEEGIAEIEARQPELEAGLTKVEAALEEIDRLLTEGRAQLDAARKEYEDGRAEYESGLVSAVTEFARLREELQNAYKTLAGQEGYEALCNQFLLYIRPGQDQQAVLDRVLAALEDTVVKKSYVYADSPVYQRIEMNLDSIETLAIYMPLVFFLVVLIVVFLFMSLVVKQCRREIGVLRALGFSKGSIRLLFCGVDLVVSAAAVALGIGIGLGIMAYIGVYFRDFFPLPAYYSALDLRTTLLAAVLTVVVGQAATLIGTTIISRILPSEAMTRPAPVTVQIPRLLDVLLRRARPMLKFSASSLLRNKGRFVFSVVCTAASVMMIFASLAFSTSKNHALRQLYGLRIRYDCQIFYNEQPDEAALEALRALPYVQNVQPLLYYEADFSANGRTEQAALNGLEAGTELVGVYDAAETRLFPQQDGVILERHLAEALGVGKGDTVKIDGLPFLITDLSEQSLSRFQYASLEAAQRLGEGSLGSIILNVEPADEQALLSYLMDQEDYLFSVFTRLAYQGNEKVFNTYDLASLVIVLFAVVIGFTIVFNTAQTNLLEKKKELCILRTLGFPHREISASWFIQSFLQYLLSCAVGLPLGIWVAKTALVKLSNDVREFVFANSLREYLFTALLVLAYIVVSHLIAMNALKHWDIVETVKEKE